MNWESPENDELVDLKTI